MRNLRNTLLASALVTSAQITIFQQAYGAEKPEEDAAATAAVKVDSRPQDVFFSPTFEAEKAWGEPAVNFHEGKYYMIYDYFPHPLGFCLATSDDGVYWKEIGPVFEKDRDRGKETLASL